MQGLSTLVLSLVWLIERFILPGNTVTILSLVQLCGRVHYSVARSVLDCWG